MKTKILENAVYYIQKFTNDNNNISTNNRKQLFIYLVILSLS